MLHAAERMKRRRPSLAGRTLRWTFEDGPTSGRTYEHSFHADGTVTYYEVEPAAAPPAARPASGPRYAAWEVAPATHLVSYLGDAGYTLTVALNLDTRRCFGVASNETEWYPVSGIVHDVTESAAA